MTTYVRAQDSFEHGILYKRGSAVEWEPKEEGEQPPPHYKKAEAEQPAEHGAPTLIPVSGVEPTSQPVTTEPQVMAEDDANDLNAPAG